MPDLPKDYSFLTTVPTDDPRSRVIVFAAGKGGVGKTTAAREFGARLASHGLSVALLDFDPQGHLALTLGMKKAPGVARLLDGDQVWDVLFQVPPERWFAGPQIGSLYLVPGDPATSAAAMRMYLQGRPLDFLAGVVDDLLTEFEIVIFDTAPSINPITPWVYAAGGLAVVPFDGGIESLEGIKQTRDGFRIVLPDSDGGELELLDLLGVLPVRVNDAFVIHQLAIQSVPGLVGRGDLLLPALSPRVAWQESAWQGLTMGVYAQGEAAAAKANQEMNRAFQVLVAKLIRLGVLERHGAAVAHG